MNSKAYHYAETLLEHTPVGVAIFGAHDLRLLEFNSSYQGFLDNYFATRPEHKIVVGKTVLDWAFHSDSTRVMEIFKEVQASGQPYRNEELPFHVGEDLSYWDFMLQPIFDDTHKMTHIVQTLNDVTKQVQARQQAERARAESQRVSNLAESDRQCIAIIERVARCLRDSLEIDTVAHNIIYAISHHIRPSKVCIFSSDSNQRALRHVCAYTDPVSKQTVSDLEYIPFEHTDLPFVPSILQQHEPIFVSNLQQAATQRQIDPQHVLVQAGIQGYAFLPLWHSNRLEGALSVLFDTPIDPDGTEARVLRGSCAYFASALAYARQHNSATREQSYLRAVLDQLPEAILIVESADGTISYANEGAAHILGYELQDILKQPLHHYRTPLTEDDLSFGGRHITPWTVIVSRALCGETIKGKEAMVGRSCGSHLITLASCAPLYGEDNIMNGAVIVFQDVTAQKTIEQHKNEFFSIANHELRTPITVIQGFTEILQLKSQQSYQFDTLTLYALRSISEQSEQLTHLIEEMMDISRIEQFRFTLQRQSHNLLTLFTHTFEAQQVAARQHTLKLILNNIQPGEHLLAFIDEERLRQALNNLVGNAIKYSSPGSQIEVGLRVQRDTEQEPEAIFWVKDEGIGIASDEIPHIFDRFYRARNVDQSQSGFGIGLYLVKEVVTRHGGRLWVESKEGQGSTFYGSLPLAAIQSGT
ncbi:ATP-binding protein [Ktedonospora formicarum]|nr:ATP-binding protein [Ktedonospora formicarum]